MLVSGIVLVVIATIAGGDHLAGRKDRTGHQSPVRRFGVDGPCRDCRGHLGVRGWFWSFLGPGIGGGTNLMPSAAPRPPVRGNVEPRKPCQIPLATSEVTHHCGETR